MARCKYCDSTIALKVLKIHEKDCVKKIKKKKKIKKNIAEYKED